MMNSFLLIILTLVLSTGLMAKSKGSFKLLTHEQYVHLTEKEKADYHIMIMELMVELESQYKTETKTYGFNKSRLEKFQKAVTQLQNIFLPNAYAAPPISAANLATEWNKLAADFASVSTRTEGNDDGNCVFAGWVSRVRRNNCIHPMAAEFNTSPEEQTVEFKGYPRDPARGCNAAQMQGKYIQCNPLIFGYKKKSEGTLFCVSTDNLAENSSFRCMTAALESNKAGNNQTDSVEARLSDLAARYTANPNAFESVINFNFKTCICPTAPAGYSSRYQNHIRPDINNPNATGKYQACYGLLRMMDKTLSACEPSTDVINPDTKAILDQFKSFTAGHSNFLSGNAGTVARDHYKTFLSSTLQQGSAQAAYNSLCSNSPVIVTPEDPVAPTCSIACVAKAGAEADSNTRKSNAVLSCNVTEVKAAGADRQLAVVQSPVVASMQIPEALPAEGTAPAIAITFTGQGITTALNASCTATYPTAAVTPQGGTPTCKAACTHTPGSAEGVTPVVAESNSCSITEVKLGDQVVDSSKGVIIQDTVRNGSPVSATITPGENVPASSVACDTNWTPASGGGDEPISDGSPSLAVTKAADGETKIKVTATATDAVGWSIHLAAQAPGTENGPTVVVSATENKSEFSFTRKTEDYQVCGQLKKTPDQKPEICVKIDKLGSPVENTNGPKPIKGSPVNVPKITPPQPPFMRNGSDTSARGIK